LGEVTQKALHLGHEKGIIFSPNMAGGVTDRTQSNIRMKQLY